MLMQKVPIPSYLFAIVAGALEKRDISDRCAVWAEPSMVDRAHWEFAETETMLETAIQLMGEYRWGRWAFFKKWKNHNARQMQLRHDRVAALLLLRRHGESVHDLCDANHHRGRPVVDHGGGP
jgi:hypothetical protein